MLLFAVCLSLCLSGVWSQFPAPCTTEKALKERCCCPQWKDGSMCGEESGRGRCTFMRERHVREKSMEEQNDDRLGWPHEYFDRVCVCKPPYDGFDCGDCVGNRTGEQCEKKKKLLRREIRELSPKERLKVFSYLSLAKMKKSSRFRILSAGNRYDRASFRFLEASVFDVGAWVRYYAYKPLLQNNIFNYSTTFATWGPAFLTWHRWYLAFMEREIQVITGDDNFTMPYYDWSRDGKHCKICTDEFMGSSDSQGVLTSSSYFANWKSICSGYYFDYKYCPVAEDGCKMEPLQRSPGANPSIPRLPTVKDVEDTIQWGSYDTPPYDTTANKSFRNVLEGFMSPSDGVTEKLSMHSLVRMFMGGSMSQDTICSADPLFLFHQAYIDKIFETWIQKQGATSAMYPTSGIPGQDPEENIVPSMPPKRNKVFLNKAESFGYTYSKYPQ